MNWTDEQKEIIFYKEPGDLLVSAAAGSGKTAVMSERVKQRILNGSIDISEILVMTFTDYAAQNMRDRIDQSLRQALQEGIESNISQAKKNYLNQQIMHLQQAHISTIHAFCLQVIKTWSTQLLDSEQKPLLETNFYVLDETRQQLLIEQALDELLAELFLLNSRLAAAPESAADLFQSPVVSISASDQSSLPFSLDEQVITLAQWLSDFSSLLDSLSSRRDYQNLKDLLLSTHRRLRSITDYEMWCREALARYKEKSENFTQSSEYQYYLETAKELLQEAEQGLADLLLLPLTDNLLTSGGKSNEEKDFVITFKSQIEAIRELRTILSDHKGDKDTGKLKDFRDNKWMRIYQLARKIDMKRPILPRRGGEKIEFMQVYARRIVPLIFFLTGQPDLSKVPEITLDKPIHIFSADLAEIESDLQGMYPKLCRFLEIVLMLDRTYSNLKIEANALDFSDFEHLAMELLRKPHINEYYRQQFREIYIDEYQDTNNVQETIIQLIAQDNVFMVGDLKQSIYRFRYANPALFAEKAARFAKSSADKGGDKLFLLNRNFRSEPVLIDSINRFFSTFMTFESAEIEYLDGHQLTANTKLTKDEALEDARIEVLLVNTKADLAADEEFNEKSGLEKETLAVILKIKELVELGLYDYKDIAVLGRTNAICLTYYEQLTAYGIPVTATGSREFFDTPELRLMEALINLLDNAQQDIPLAAIMRSGLIRPAFTERELLQMRQDYALSNKNTADIYFYDCVFYYREHGPDDFLRAKVDKFLATLSYWRELEQFMSISELIGYIFTASDLPDRVSLMPNGAQRLRDLEIFREWADSFERGHQYGLYNFALYIRKIREQKLKDSGFTQVESIDNAVQIMTVHGSKGLEFPVVFLVRADYNYSSSKGDDLISVSENGGITAMAIDPIRSEGHMTALHYYHLLKNYREDKAETYRLFYVAMTRAKSKLFVVAYLNINEKKGNESKLRLLQAPKIWKSRIPYKRELSDMAKSWLDLLLLATASEENLNLESWFDARETAFSTYRSKENKYYNFTFYQAQYLYERIFPQAPILPALDDRLIEKQDELIQESLTREGVALDVQTKALSHERAVEAASYKQLWHKRLTFTYPYADLLDHPSKLTVSGLKRLQEQMLAVGDPGETAIDLSAQEELDPLSAYDMTLTARQPSSKHEQELHGAPLGSLLHSIFQFIDLTALSEEATEEEIKEQIIDMAKGRVIYESQLEQALKWSPQVLSYVNSSLGQTVRTIELEQGPVFREMPFILSKQDLLTDIYSTSQDFVLVQGMIDCWFVEAEEATIIDFKSDYLPGDPANYPEMLRQKYALQLEYYTQAIEEATKYMVKNRYIWLIRYQKAIRL